MATKTYTDNAEWNEIATEALPAGLAATYADYKAAQRLAAQAREAFEAAFTEMVAPAAGTRWGFGYRFGKLSVAALPATASRPTRAAPKALDLAALRAMTGHRSI